MREPPMRQTVRELSEVWQDVYKRQELAEEGKETIQVLVERMNVPHIAEQMKNLEAYNQEIAKRCPWVPFAQ